MTDILLIFQAARKGRSLTFSDHLFQCLEVFTLLKNIFLLDKYKFPMLQMTSVFHLLREPEENQISLLPV